MDRSRRFAAAALLGLTLSVGCSTRGPVDRSVDAAHATNTTIGETAEDAADGPKSAVVGALTFPFRLVGRVFDALFG
jgi:hypothetical protein